MSEKPTLIAIDPGPVQSGWVRFDGDQREFAKEPNETVLQRCEFWEVDHAAIEIVQSYGMTAGQDLFMTCVWAGRFAERFSGGNSECFTLIPRPTVKKHITGRASTNDAKVRATLIDMYGGKERAVGLKKSPGPLYGMKSDIWAALAVGHAWYMQQGLEKGR